jgi:hypothetical protein
MSKIDRLPRYVAIKLVKQEQAFMGWAVVGHGRESELRDELLQPTTSPRDHPPAFVRHG